MKYVQPVGGLANDPYVDANPVGGIEGSAVPAASIEHPMRELVALITDAGLTPTEADLSQVAKAIKTIFQKSAPVSAAASGTVDAITANYTPAIAALTDHLLLIVRAGGANTSTTPTFTPASATITAKTIVKGHNQPLVAGDISGAGFRAELQYDLTLDKWVLLNPATGVSAIAAASVQGVFKNLQVSSTGLNANVSVTADEIAVEDSANAYQTLRSVTLTIAGTSSGVANGLDTGVLAVSTWYSVWVIWNGTTKAGLLSLSATAPTLPSGYTHKARVGWMRTDSTANKYPLGFTQRGRSVQYLVNPGTNVITTPVMASGAAGSISTPTYISVGVSSVVPSTASFIKIALASLTGAGGLVAPNANYGAVYTGANQAPICTTTSGGGGNEVSMMLEGNYPQNVYWASNSASNSLICYGWEDNI
jgi:hypothetical protein